MKRRFRMNFCKRNPRFPTQEFEVWSEFLQPTSNFELEIDIKILPSGAPPLLNIQCCKTIKGRNQNAFCKTNTRFPIQYLEAWSEFLQSWYMICLHFATSRLARKPLCTNAQKLPLPRDDWACCNVCKTWLLLVYRCRKSLAARLDILRITRDDHFTLRTVSWISLDSSSEPHFLSESCFWILMLYNTIEEEDLGGTLQTMRNSDVPWWVYTRFNYWMGKLAIDRLGH